MTTVHVEVAHNGERVRKGKNEAPTTGLPTVPTTVAATRTDTTATITWGAPASDGGTPITGYRVIRTGTGGSTQNVGSTIRTATFTGLVAAGLYGFTVAATNANGTGPAVTVAVSPTTGPVTAVRFPGDPGAGSRELVLGLDEFDKNPESKLSAEDAAPETLTGTAGNRVRAGGTRFYYNGWQNFGSGGAVWGDITENHNKGRIPWVSCNQTKGQKWAAQLTGATLTAMRGNFAYFIDRVETTLDKPVWSALLHEPENQTISKGGGDGTEAEWLQIQKVFREEMVEFERTHGGVGNYRWKNLAFSHVMTAYCYFEAGKAGGIDRYIPTQADADVFDFSGADYYAWTVGAPTWGGNIVAAVNWCKKYGKALGLAEFGIHHENPDAGTRLQDFYNRCLDPANNIVAAFFYNSAVSDNNRTLPAQRWMLNNGGTFQYYGSYVNGQNVNPLPLRTYTNANMLDKYVALLKAPTSVHFWDLVNPATGAKYPKPAGATF